MPSKNPAVKRRAQERYRKSAKGKAARKAGKATWDKTEAGRASKAKSEAKWRQTPEYRAGQAKGARVRKYMRKEWLHGIKSKLSCVSCGYDKHPAALHFHHTGTDKVSEIAKMVHNTNMSLDRVLAEMAKCVILCANCHAVLHYEEHQERKQRQSAV